MCFVLVRVLVWKRRVEGSIDDAVSITVSQARLAEGEDGGKTVCRGRNRYRGDKYEPNSVTR